MKVYLLLFFIGYSLLGCTSLNKSHLNSGIGITVQSDLGAKIEVDTSKKLTGYASGIYLFHLFKVGGDSKYTDGIDYGEGKPGFFEKYFNITHDVKSAASYNAIRTSTADVLISPQYVIETNNWNPFYKQIKVKVMGYPGRVISIRNK